MEVVWQIVVMIDGFWLCSVLSFDLQESFEVGEILIKCFVWEILVQVGVIYFFEKGGKVYV